MAAPIVLGITIRADGSTQVRRDLQGTRADLESVGRAAQGSNRQFAEMASGTFGLGSALRGMAAGLSIVALYQSAIKEIKLADQMNLLDGRIKIATSSQTDYINSSKELVAISLRTGTSFEANATIFSRTNKAVEEMGYTAQTTTALTETMAQTMRISGASTGEAASTVRQLSQALSSGVLRGDEFNSMMENAPRLATALAAGLHVSIGSLRAMAENGELTSKRVIDAIVSQGTVIDAEFKRMPLSVGAAVENFKTAFGQYILGADKSAGATSALALTINSVAGNITLIADSLIVGTAGLIGYFSALNIQALISFAAAQLSAAAAIRATEVAALQAAASATAANAQTAASALALAEANVVSAQSTVHRMDVQLGHIRSTLALVPAEKAALQSTIVSSEAIINQSRATLLATDTMIQNTSIMYIRQQALAAMTAAEVTLATTTVELAAIQQRQLVLSQQVALTMNAQAAATTGFSAATIAQAEAQTASAAATAASAVSAEQLDASTSLAGKSMGGLRSMMALIAGINPFALIATGVAAAATAAYLYRGELVTVGADTVTVGNIAESTWLMVRNAAVDTMDEIIARYPGVSSAAGTAAAFIGEAFASSWRMVKDLASLAIDGVVGLFGGMGSALGVAAAGIVEVFSQSFEKIKAMAGGVGLGIEAAMAGDLSFADFNAALNTKVKGFSDVGKDMGAAFVSGFTASQGATQKLGEAFDSLSGKVIDGATTLHALNTMVDANAAASEQAGQKNSGLATAQQASGDAAKKAAAEAKKHAEAITKEIDALNDQHLKLSLSERDYELSKLAALGMKDAVLASSMAIWDSNKALDAQKSSSDKAKSEMDSLTDKYNKLTMSARDYYATTLKNKDGTPLDSTLATPLMQKFDQVSGAEESAKKMSDAHSLLQKYNDELKSTNKNMGDLGATSTNVFDGALGGFNRLAGSLDAMVKSVDANAKSFEELRKKKEEINAVNLDPKSKTYLIDLKTQSDLQNKNQKDYAALQAKSLNDSIDGIRQVASATSQMFEQNSTEAKAFNLVALAGLAAKAAAAMLTQGEGDPYTAFARIAAMGALVSAIVSAGGGGGFNFSGGSNKSPGPQGLSSDTGSVLGDSSSKSESIDKTYNLLKDIHASEYATLQSIDRGIADLHSGITDVITRLFQAGGLATVNAPASKQTGIAGAFGSVLHVNPIAFDPILEWLLGSMFGGKKTSSVTAQGISTGATSIADVMAGKNLQAQQFAQIETKTSGGWFSNDKYSQSTQYAALDASTQKALNDVFGSMGKTMLGLADNLGLGLSDRVKNYIIPALSVDLKGLNGEDAAKKLNGVISAALDTMSTTVFGDLLGQYQQLGEGMLETAVRIVAEVAVVKDSLSKSGLSISGDAIAISDGLAQAAGGIKEFQKQFDSYYQKFYTDAERNVFTQKQLASQLSDVNLLLPATRDGYRHLVEALNINNAADQERYSLLLKLSGAADTYYSGVETAAKAAQQIADQQRSLDIQLMEASGNAIGALTAKRKDELAAMDASLRFSQQAVWALSAANKAVDDGMNVLKKSVSDQKALNNTAYQAALSANAIQKQSATDLLAALKTVAGNIKTALGSTVVESDAFTRQRRLSAQSVLVSALSSAKAGGSLANFAGLDQALIDIAKPSEQLYTSFIDFARDQGRTGNVISGLADYTAAQVSVAEQTLNAVEANNKLLTDAFNAENARLDALITYGQSQIDAINGTTATVMTVADAVSNLSAVMNAKMTVERSITIAKNAEGREFDAKAVYDAALAQAAQSQQNVTAAIDAANKAALAASAAKAAASAPITAAPTTYINGQSGNAIWEQILSGFNAAHQARFGTPMNRAWGSDSDAQNQYQQLVAQYNVNSAAAVAAAQATAAQLANVAAASAALIPSYAATAAVDQAAADQAGAAYATASSYAAAARAAVPGINSFEVGTNYVLDERWAKIHPGERIMPAADNREIIRRMGEPAPSNNGSDLAAEISKLNVVVARLQSELEKITKNTGNMERHTGDTATVLKKCTLGGDKVRTVAA